MHRKIYVAEQSAALALIDCKVFVRLRTNELTLVIAQVCASPSGTEGSVTETQSSVDERVGEAALEFCLLLACVGNCDITEAMQASH